MTPKNTLTLKVFMIICSAILKANAHLTLDKFKNIKMLPLKR